MGHSRQPFQVEPAFCVASSEVQSLGFLAHWHLDPRSSKGSAQPVLKPWGTVASAEAGLNQRGRQPHPASLVPPPRVRVALCSS